MVSDPLCPSQLPYVFPTIEPHIKRVAALFEGESPSELYRLLENGSATLHAIEGEGFIIAEWTETDCYVICAAALEKVTMVAIHDIISITAEWVKQLGCKTLSFSSPRAAWGRITKGVGFKLVDGTFVKEL